MVSDSAVTRAKHNGPSAFFNFLLLFKHLRMLMTKMSKLRLQLMQHYTCRSFMYQVHITEIEYEMRV